MTAREAKRKVHYIGQSWTEWRGRYAFHYAFTLCIGDIWVPMTKNWRKVTCKRCLAARKGKVKR